MKKILFSTLLLLGPCLSTYSKNNIIPVYTECGKTVYLNPKDYKDSKALIDDAQAINDALCKKHNINGNSNSNTNMNNGDNNGEKIQTHRKSFQNSPQP